MDLNNQTMNAATDNDATQPLPATEVAVINDTEIPATNAAEESVPAETAVNATEFTTPAELAETLSTQTRTPTDQQSGRLES